MRNLLDYQKALPVDVVVWSAGGSKVSVGSLIDGSHVRGAVPSQDRVLDRSRPCQSMHVTLASPVGG